MGKEHSMESIPAMLPVSEIEEEKDRGNDASVRHRDRSIAIIITLDR